MSLRPDGKPMRALDGSPHQGRLGQEVITRADIGRYSFSAYRKIGTTQLSDELLPVGTRVETLEGEYVCAEPSRLAIDTAGNVYPVAESVRLASYELAE